MLEPIRLFEKTHGPARLVLAPMSGITDCVFRLLMREMGVQIVVSDLISADGLFRQGPQTLIRMNYYENERPIGIQLFGGDETALVEATKLVEQTGVDFVDLNLGCPVKKVVKRGGGAAWLREPVALGKLLTKMKKATSIPLTIKIRTGWDDEHINAFEVIQTAYDSGVSWVAVHGRTRAQGYTGKADWELIKRLSQESPIPIIGNGDILSADFARTLLEGGYAHALMIGRGALKNPWIFSEILGNQSEVRSFLPLIERHFELVLNQKDKRRALHSMKKFLAWYASGLPGASAFRQQVFSLREVEELKSLAMEYYEKIDPSLRKVDTTNFLMGGPG